MQKIYTSASKLVFVGLALTACIGFIIGKLPVDQFMILTMAGFSFYFGKK
jgi:hypothetical protein